MIPGRLDLPRFPEIIWNIAETDFLDSDSGHGPKEQVGTDGEPRFPKFSQVRQERLAHPAGIARCHNAQIDVGFRYSGTPAVKPREDLNDILQFMADRDDHHILIPDLSDAINLGVNLHCVHAIAESFVLDAFRKLLKRLLILLLLGVECEQLLNGGVSRSRCLTYSRVGNPKVRRFFSIHVESDVVLCQRLMPVVYRRPPIWLPSEEDAEGGGTLLTIDDPQSWPLRVVRVLLFNGPTAVPYEKRADGVVQPQRFEQISDLSRFPHETALEFGNAPAMIYRPIDELTDLDPFVCHPLLLVTGGLLPLRQRQTCDRSF